MSRVVTPPLASPTNSPPLSSIPQEKIAQRAYEKWIKRGRPEGSEMQDWLEAENELKAEVMRGKSASKY